MPRFLIHAVTLVALFCCASAAARGQSQRGGEQTLTNASVIKLVKGGFSDKAVIAIISSRPNRFDLSTEQLLDLKKRGVSERVILAMLGSAPGGEFSDEWGDDDSFFSTSRGPGDGKQAGGGVGGSDPGEVNIFGSSGGSRGRTRSRGNSGGIENDTETVGSASVRIIKPPAEAGGGGTPKLERTPTLTNESVVQLVEGGFSEGTIIRRIEQSPAEFDLSDKGLADLRRRRVTEPVIAAMRSAMSDEPIPATRP